MSPRQASPEQQARNARVDRIVELFTSGYSQDYVCEQGVVGGWTRDDVLTVVRQRGWPLDGSGRLPLQMRPQRQQPARPTRTARGARGPKTPIEGTPPGTVRAGGAGTAPVSPESGHGKAGPDAQPQVSPSRSHLPEDGGGLGASDVPVGPPATGAGWTAEGIRSRVDAMTPRTHADGSINAQHVALEQTFRSENGLPSYIADLDGPGKFRVSPDGWVWDDAARSYVEREPESDASAAALLDDVAAAVAADGGGVLHPATAASDPVEKPDTGHPDLLAAGLQHAHPAVRAKAQIVVKAVDALVSAMVRHRDA